MSLHPDIAAVLNGDSEGCIVCGNCLEIMPDMPDGCVDAVVTDPPYGTEGLGGGYGRRHNHDPEGRHGRRISNDTDLSVLEGGAPLIYRLCGANAWLFTFCAARRRYEATEALVAAGWEPYGEYIWDKARPGLGYTIRYSHETALVCRKGEPERSHGALLSVTRCPVFGTPIHPHEKPSEVLQPLVQFASIGDGLILDPFCGSGTTCVAAKKLGRRWIGIDIDEGYCDTARNRLRDTERPLFGGK